MVRVFRSSERPRDGNNSINSEGGGQEFSNQHHDHLHERTPLLCESSGSDESSSSFNSSPIDSPTMTTTAKSNKTQQNDGVRSSSNSRMTMFLNRQYSTFEDHIRRNKIYVNLGVSILLGLVSGSMYGYGRYARDLKDTLGLNQFQLERFGILLDTGNYFGHPLTGYIYDYYGPQVACLSGAAIVFISYFMIHLAVTHQETIGMVPGMLDASFFFVGFGIGLGYIAALASTTKNFKTSSRLSLAVGVVASGYALCSTLVGLSYDWLGLDHFFLFWAVLVAVMNILGAVSYNEEANPDSMIKLGEENHQRNRGDEHNSPHSNHGCSDDGSTIISSSDDEREISSLDNIDLEQQVIREESAPYQRTSSTWSALGSSEFWILFSAFACCTGCGLFVINNVSTMVESLGGTDKYASNLVIVLSFANCIGRILMGSLADRPNADKVFLLGCTSIVMALALYASAYAPLAYAQAALFWTVTLVATAYGGAWVLIVGILSKWFGTENFGSNYGVMACGPAVSGMLFNFASAWLYQRVRVNQDDDIFSGNEFVGVCMGTRCYHGAFLITGTAAVLCTILLCFLSYRRQRSSPKDDAFQVS